jgi:CRP/FNR family cyclic AMP-dependent transcriptional regulator
LISNVAVQPRLFAGTFGVVLPGDSPIVRILEVDPELGLRVPVAQIAQARRSLVAPLRALEPGFHAVPPEESGRGYLGYLIVEGLVARNLVLAGHTSTELLGEGDFLQPWLAPRDDGLVRHAVVWRIVDPVKLAVLDERFARALNEWPQVTQALLERALRRTHGMAIHQALLQLSPAETRLLVLFWHLAERWGRVSRGGIVLRLHLTHELLGQLVGCQRASVTTALKHLIASGLVVRRADASWLLTGTPPDELADVHWAEPSTAPLVTAARA